MSTLCKRAIPHTVKVAKSLEADVLEDGGGRLCGEGNKFSEDIMVFVLGIRTWDSSTLGSSAVTVAKSLKDDVLEDDHGNGGKLSKVNILLSDIELMLDLANVIHIIYFGVLSRSVNTPCCQSSVTTIML